MIGHACMPLPERSAFAGLLASTCWQHRDPTGRAPEPRVSNLHESAQQPAAPRPFSLLYLCGSGKHPVPQTDGLFCVLCRHLPQKVKSATITVPSPWPAMPFSLLRYKRKLDSDQITTSVGVGWHATCRCEYKSSVWNGELTSVACPWTDPMGLCQDFGHK